VSLFADVEVFLQGRIRQALPKIHCKAIILIGRPRGMRSRPVLGIRQFISVKWLYYIIFLIFCFINDREIPEQWIFPIRAAKEFNGESHGYLSLSLSINSLSNESHAAFLQY
jgi:hypothetical protein